MPARTVAVGTAERQLGRAIPPSASVMKPSVPCPVGDEALAAARGVALLGHEQNHGACVAGPLADGRIGPYTPRAADRQRDVDGRPLPDVGKRDDRDLASRLLMDVERDAVDLIDRRRQQHVRGVDDDLRRVRPVATRCGRKLSSG